MLELIIPKESEEESMAY